VSFAFATRPGSFRSASLKVLPRRSLSGAACLIAASLLSGCGSAHSSPSGQSVAGAGFRFEAPLSWVVTRSARASMARRGPLDQIEVVRFGLVRSYRPELFRGAARELDAAISKLAKQLSGRVTSRATEQLAGGPARFYRIAYSDGKMQEIAFVLSGDREYELLCRRLASEPDAPCRELFQSFAFASG
jgi:hypothetical protein